jgi:polar amino acid transport system ATP-binding protein
VPPRHSDFLSSRCGGLPEILTCDAAWYILSASMVAPLIQVEKLEKSFHGVSVLRGIDLVIDPSQLTVLIGPSGCGKSTLLRCLNGLETFDAGRLVINGVCLERSHVSEREMHRKMHALRRTMGMVFQSFNLFPHMTTLENVARPPCIVQGIREEEARSHARRLLEKVGLQDKAQLYPTQLSGGQQQRAAIARALAMKPKVLLYDEPTSALDPGLVDEVLQVMKELDQEGITQLVVTHEMRFARDVADKIVFLDQGRVVEEGPPGKIFSDPSDSRTRQFLRHYL